MAQTLAEKTIAEHLASGEMTPGSEIAIAIDQTLTQDATGTMAFLQFEALGVPRARARLSVSYVDHNMLQTGFESADDHRYLQSAAAKYGVYFSRPGNGICHQVHLERFAGPGQTLLGSDSHTPTCGGMGMIAIGAGGLDVAAAMAGQPFYVVMPEIIRVLLTGRLPAWVAAKDVILELLRRLSVKGGVGKIFEYAGPGVAALSVPERASITNMGAELGATTSLFPSDERTREYLAAQDRAESWVPLAADDDARYSDTIEIDLSGLEPLVARPSSPDNVCPVGEVEGTSVAQVCIGSCTNSSFGDLMTVAAIVGGKHVHPGVSATISPGSRQALEAIGCSGALANLAAAGFRILECACGPCLGMGQAPPSGAASVRTFNRNFPGRSGTPDDKVYLSSAEVAAATALAGEIADPRRLGDPPSVETSGSLPIDDSMIIAPAAEPSQVEIVRGPNIKPVPVGEPLPDRLQGEVVLSVGDNISTDHILPAGAKVLPLRSNIPAISEFAFERVDSTFAERIRAAGGGFVVAGINYGQGSSREHAAMAPAYLGLRAVIAKSFARIHRSNLINFGILPLMFAADGEAVVGQGDRIEISGLHTALRTEKPFVVRNLSRGTEFEVRHDLTEREARIILAGGLLNHIRSRTR